MSFETSFGSSNLGYHIMSDVATCGANNFAHPNKGWIGLKTLTTWRDIDQRMDENNNENMEWMKMEWMKKRLKCGRDKNGLIFFKDENKEGTKVEWTKI